MAKIDEGALSLFYDYQIKDLNGKLLKKSRKYRSHSFVKQFIQFLYGGVSGADTFDFVDTSNTSRTVTVWGTSTSLSLYCYFGGGSDNDDVGLVVGTGSTAVSINDYALATKVIHGTSAGQLSYSSMLFGAPSTDATGTTYRITRDFTNNSGGNITLNELGLITGTIVSGTNRYVLIVRDVLSPSITVNNLTTLTINYNLRTTI